MGIENLFVVEKETDLVSRDVGNLSAEMEVLIWAVLAAVGVGNLFVAERKVDSAALVVGNPSAGEKTLARVV